MKKKTLKNAGLVQTKYMLYNILNCCCGFTLNTQQVYNSLPATYQIHVSKINKMWSKSSQYPSAMWVLNYLNNYVFRRNSLMKTAIIKFINYNSSYPNNLFAIPPTRYLFTK